MEQRFWLELLVENLGKQERKRSEALQHEQLKGLKQQVRQYFERTLEELKHRHEKEMESFRSQHRTRRQGDDDRNARFNIAQRVPLGSYESDAEDVDCRR